MNLEGEIYRGECRREIISVTQLNEYIKAKLEGDAILSDIHLRGEISNFTNHYKTGHFYFTIKDEGSAVKAVMFRGYASKLKFMPENGMKIVARGRIGAYVRDGQYQIYCEDMEPDGVGALYVAYEQLKRKLEAEGLFSPQRKKPLPKIPSKIGVITSPTGAAVRDIINILSRRFPYAEMILYPALVQGAEAAPSLIRGMKILSSRDDIDVIIIGRGGGSIEDLWAFNDERLARVIASSTAPVISAVGHETDFTICDFVSDRRAPTPSAAAEIAVPDTRELMQKISNVTQRCRQLLTSSISVKAKSLQTLSLRPVMKNPQRYIDDRKMDLVALDEKLCRAVTIVKNNKASEYSVLCAKLEALSPLSVLSRGYSFVSDTEGKIQKSAKDVSQGKKIRIGFFDGDAECTVDRVNFRDNKHINAYEE